MEGRYKPKVTFRVAPLTGRFRTRTRRPASSVPLTGRADLQNIHQENPKISPFLGVYKF